MNYNRPNGYSRPKILNNNQNNYPVKNEQYLSMNNDNLADRGTESCSKQYSQNTIRTQNTMSGKNEFLDYRQSNRNSNSYQSQNPNTNYQNYIQYKQQINPYGINQNYSYGNGNNIMPNSFYQNPQVQNRNNSSFDAKNKMIYNENMMYSQNPYTQLNHIQVNNQINDNNMYYMQEHNIIDNPEIISMNEPFPYEEVPNNIYSSALINGPPLSFNNQPQLQNSSNHYTNINSNRISTHYYNQNENLINGINYNQSTLKTQPFNSGVHNTKSLYSAKSVKDLVQPQQKGNVKTVNLVPVKTETYLSKDTKSTNNRSSVSRTSSINTQLNSQKPKSNNLFNSKNYLNTNYSQQTVNTVVSNLTQLSRPPNKNNLLGLHKNNISNLSSFSNYTKNAISVLPDTPINNNNHQVNKNFYQQGTISTLKTSTEASNKKSKRDSLSSKSTCKSSNLTINLEDLLLHEEKILEIMEELNSDPSSPCYEWWAFFISSSLTGKFENFFKDEVSKKIITEHSILEFITIILCYDCEMNDLTGKMEKYFTQAFSYINNSLMLFSDYLLSKINSNINNIWVNKLRCLVKQKLKPIPNNKDENIKVILYNNDNIIKLNKLILKEHTGKEDHLDLLYNYLFNTANTNILILSDIFRNKVLKFRNTNKSVLASALTPHHNEVQNINNVDLNSHERRPCPPQEEIKEKEILVNDTASMRTTVTPYSKRRTSLKKISVLQKSGNKSVNASPSPYKKSKLLKSTSLNNGTQGNSDSISVKAKEIAENLNINNIHGSYGDNKEKSIKDTEPMKIEYKQYTEKIESINDKVKRNPLRYLKLGNYEETEIEANPLNARRSSATKAANLQYQKETKKEEDKIDLNNKLKSTKSIPSMSEKNEKEIPLVTQSNFDKNESECASIREKISQATVKTVKSIKSEIKEDQEETNSKEEDTKNNEETKEVIETPIAPYIKGHDPLTKKYCLVLDLDETLIHFKINPKKPDQGEIRLRPYMFEFLEQLSPFYELIMFTAATKDVSY